MWVTPDSDPERNDILLSSMIFANVRSYGQESALYFGADVAPKEVWLIAGVPVVNLIFTRGGLGPFPFRFQF